MKRTVLHHLALLACLPVAAWAAPSQHTFTLRGGYFYGPGPIVPDTALPDGAIRGISFDLDKLEGVAAYSPKGGRTLSDGKTTTNGNIDAGALEIGSGGAKAEAKPEASAAQEAKPAEPAPAAKPLAKEGKTFWLYAVAGGPNEGTERYRFDADYNMVWTVDLGLDPGFPEGIVRVNGFELTTGIRRIPSSLQTAKGLPEGYDKAGTLATGATLVGRVGDFDSDGYLDGVIVAAANVPMQADMLPGAPVGNKRGFSTDIRVSPLFAMELTLRGVVNLRPLVRETLTGNHLAELSAYLKDIQERLMAARGNYEAAFVASPPLRRMELREVGWRLESIRQMIYIPVAFLDTYKFPSGNAPNSIVDATARAIDKAEDLAKLLEQGRKDGTLPLAAPASAEPAKAAESAPAPVSAAQPEKHDKQRGGGKK